MGRESLGEFELQVLLAILRLGAESYSVPIVLELEEKTERSIAPAAVYIALRRLEKKGLVVSRMSSASPEEGGRPRRYFKLTKPASGNRSERWSDFGTGLERYWSRDEILGYPEACRKATEALPTARGSRRGFGRARRALPGTQFEGT